MARAPGLPRPAVFTGLLGGRGTYAVTPADRWHVWGGHYEGGSLIWRSRRSGPSRTECREALATPADSYRTVILRRITAVDGPARVNVDGSKLPELDALAFQAIAAAQAHVRAGSCGRRGCRRCRR